MKWVVEKELAIRAAREAGAFLRAHMLGAQTVLLDEGRDIKIQADRDAEKLILDMLAGTGHPVLAEESGEHGLIDTNSPYWVVDPLDGTMNFARNLPICAVSIALCIGDTPELGVIYDFNRDECFEGSIESGARCNGQAVRVSELRDAAKAILSTGVPSRMSLEGESLDRFVAKLKGFKKVRMIGSAAMSLALVACGRVDIYSEEAIFFWDVAAGVALVRAAGGIAEVERSGASKWAVNVWAACDPCMWGHVRG